MYFKYIKEKKVLYQGFAKKLWLCKLKKTVTVCFYISIAIFFIFKYIAILHLL